MFLKDFYSRDGQLFQITPEQASQFAKSIADDYNPIHDPDARRFCVPGDLLFALVLSEYGVSQEMSFSFDGMLGANRPILFPDAPGETFAIQDAESAMKAMRAKLHGEFTNHGQPCWSAKNKSLDGKSKWSKDREDIDACTAIGVSVDEILAGRKVGDAGRMGKETTGWLLVLVGNNLVLLCWQLPIEYSMLESGWQ